MKKEINLLPEKYKNIRQRNRVKKLKTACIIVLVFLIMACVYIPHLIIARLLDESVALKNQIAGMKDVSDYNILRRELEKDVAGRREIIHSLQSKANEWSKIIADIGQKVPEGMELTAISFADGDVLKITGRTLNYNLAAQFLANLQSMDIFSEVDPTGITQQENGLIDFDFKCVVPNGSDKHEAE